MSDPAIASEIQLVQQAISFAARAHRHHFRKDDATPYVAHPFRVFFVVRHVFGVDDPAALCAALLHDTIEDTTVDYDELLAEFGEKIADAVAALTKDMRLREDIREPAYDRQLKKAAWQARLVKLADVYDNFCDAQHLKTRKSIRKKAARAIHCAGAEKRLAKAVKIVRKLTAE